MARARSFGSIRELPSGKFQARYWHLGNQIAAEHTFAAKTDARRWLSTVEADIVRGDSVDPDAGKITFGEYASWWIEQRPRPAAYETNLRRPAEAHHAHLRGGGPAQHPTDRRPGLARRVVSRSPASEHRQPNGRSPSQYDTLFAPDSDRNVLR